MSGSSILKRNYRTIGRWWWEVDHLIFGLVIGLIGIGIVLSFAASPAVAIRLQLETFYFVKRQILFACIALGVFFGVSLISPQRLKILAWCCYVIIIGLLLTTLGWGIEIKGARRWLLMGGTSIQVSEFMKPILAILNGAILAYPLEQNPYRSLLFSAGITSIPLLLIIFQPDFGMAFVIVMTWIVQLFIAGLPLFGLAGFTCISGMGVYLAYLFLPHVTTRIDQFLSPQVDVLNELYQVTKSLQAFMHGHLFGRGPGEGLLKNYVPDVHADFIFAVVGEEFGLVGCLVIILCFSLLLIRCLQKAFGHPDGLHLLMIAGLSSQLFFQISINIASSLHLIPTKGMTLPFLSYGGSSLLAVSLGMGMILSLSRKQVGVWLTQPK